MRPKCAIKRVFKHGPNTSQTPPQRALKHIPQRVLKRAPNTPSNVPPTHPNASPTRPQARPPTHPQMRSHHLLKCPPNAPSNASSSRAQTRPKRAVKHAPHRVLKRIPNASQTRPQVRPKRVPNASPTLPQAHPKRLPNAPPTHPHKIEDKYSFFSVSFVSNYLNLGPFPRRPGTRYDAPSCPPLSCVIIARPPPPVGVSDVLACPPPPSRCRCTFPLCGLLHAPPLCVAARRTPARACTCRRTVHAHVWGKGKGAYPRNRAVLRCTGNIARCTRTRNRMGTVFSGTGRGVTRGTRGLPVSCLTSAARPRL